MRIMLAASLALAMVACNGSANQVKDEANKSGAETAAAAKESAEKSHQKTKEEAKSEGTKQVIKAAAENPARSDKNIARNKYRHPVETLSFFGIEPGMTVVEIWPGGGWYTEVLAPVLTDGELVAAHFAPKTDKPDHYTNRLYKSFNQRVENDPIFANVRSGMLQPGQKVDMGPAGSADMVVTFRNIHSFIGQDILDGVFEESYKVLKPGGIFGVVEHRAKEGTDVNNVVESGYVPTAFVVERAKAAGFELVEASEINANPKDTTEHPEGVWTLLPTLRLGETDQAKYKEIGESDRMTLKFRKVVQDDTAQTESAVDADEVVDAEKAEK